MSIRQAIGVAMVAGPSMEPALSSGQLVVIMRRPLARWLMGPIQPGELVQIQANQQADGRSLVKRVVGTEGDTLIIAGERVTNLAVAARGEGGTFRAPAGPDLKWSWRVCSSEAVRQQQLRLAFYRRGADVVQPVANGRASREVSVVRTPHVRASSVGGLSAHVPLPPRAACKGGRWHVWPLTTDAIRDVHKAGLIRQAIPGWRLDTRVPDTLSVPLGHLYVVGDNRPVSVDSRAFGPVPLSHITGRVVARL